MSALSIQVPFPVFQDRDGQPLDHGYIWIGQPNLNPQTSPVVAYYDDALTIVATQPLRTINGYVSRAGTPAQIYVDAVNFSILVQDSKGSMVYNFPEGTGISPNSSGVAFTGFNGQVGNVQNLAGDDGSDWIGFEQVGASAVAMSVQSKLRETVSVKDFGAVADWNGTTGTDNTAAFAAAVARLASVGGGTLLIPPGNYKGVLKINCSDVHVIGYGANIGFTAAETLTIEPPLGASNLAPFLGFAPASNVPISPASGAVFYDITNSSQGSRAVTVTNSAGIVAGNYCLVISGTSPIATPSTNYIPDTCQIRKVIGVSGNDVWFDEPNDVTITSFAEHPYLIKWDFVSNIKIEGLTINNFYGAAYCVSFSGCVGLTLEKVTFEPISAWGAFASCRNVRFDQCTINNAYSGFSSGRMTDDLVFVGCVVSCTDTDLSISQNYFYFCEENPKSVRIVGCRGVDAGVFFYGGNGWTDITISDSKFDVFKSGVSAFRLTTFSPGARVSSINTAYISRGGNSAAPYDEVPNAVCAVAYSPSGITFNDCTITQLGVGTDYGYNYGSIQESYIDSRGVVFPAGRTLSTNARVLDDYLEQSFTPTFPGFTFGGVTTIHRAEYIKIGRVVHEVIEISNSVSISATSGAATIRTFPIDPTYEVPGTFCKGLTAVATPYVRTGDFGFAPTFTAGANERVTFNCTYFVAS